MSDPDSTIFEPGKTYVPTLDFTRQGVPFRKGERLVFKRAAFAIYDEVYYHEFLAEDGSTKTWFLLKSERPIDWTRYFSCVG